MKKITITSMLIALMFLSACNTAYYAAHPKQHLDLVKATPVNKPIEPQRQQLDTLAITSIKQVGVSVSTNEKSLQEFIATINTTAKINQHHSLLSKIIEKKLLKKIKTVNDSASDQNNNSGAIGLIVIGLILLIVSIFILWFVSILGGALLGLFGLILLIVGLATNTPSSQPNRNEPAQQQTQPQKQYQDVVYLKDGSIIKGMIIEQIPGTSLKIQTVDGSVFVEQMTNVDKITKEVKQ